ncbi:MAG: 23S rRNA (guanosine(2251)-2'-O)-methyltransferase RlmB, partial [Alphaproteobacteria bacterium]|nr:23S rRNA (guanosine(2251)-2'-O)-methyltransferase RlmB [Alphaproteobacteria bacterium]
DRRRLEALLPDGAVHQGLALEAEPLPDPGLDGVLRGLAPQARAVVLLLDQVTDPHNVGAILRSAAAFGAAALVMTERHAPPVTGTLARAASGALEAVPVCRVVNLARTLRELAGADFLCLGLAEEAPRTLPAVAPAPRTALVVGAEGAGLRRLTRETCHVLARLPTARTFTTLNASNAAAVALYELTVRAGH